ncbi:hypothetical protein LJC33_06560 [Eubacteriales bacterium OttesenSCG-928-N13]|nr:hypothetical protein [Eubacteriales bacterium OttesenSCG-928-N13]
MGKIYARQIPAEHQESPLYYGDEYWSDGVIVTGNKQFHGRTTSAYDTIIENLDNAADDMYGEWYATTAEYFNEAFPPDHTDFYSRKEVEHWERIAQEWGTSVGSNEESLICQALSLMTGKEYSFDTIHGCCQGDWQNCFYPAELNPGFIEVFETEYFNTGTEWIVHDEKDAPETPEEISGYSIYCCSHNPADEIAKETGTTPDNVILYEFDGYVKYPIYKARIHCS